MTPKTMNPRTDNSSGAKSKHQLARLVQAHFETIDRIRRGVCLLNAGRYDEAEALFTLASKNGSASEPLPSYLAACLLGQGATRGATSQFEEAMASDPAQETGRIRTAYARWRAGRSPRR